METLKEKIDRAMELHRKGYNCAQCVTLVFADECEISPELAAKCAAGLGAGVGALGEICGVVTGMAVVTGMRGNGDADSKKKANPAVNALGKEFLAANGNLRCRDLKTPGARKSCDELIASGIEMLYNQIYNQTEK